MKRKNLILFTHSFPFGHSEAFLETEIKYLSESFEEIIIFPMYANTRKEKREVPNNVRIYEMKNGRSAKIKSILNSLIDRQMSEWLLKELKIAQGHGVRGVAAMVNWFGWAKIARDSLVTYFNNEEDQSNYIIYCYWQNPSALGSVLFKEKFKDAVIYSRAHGGDLYVERHKPPYIPFQFKVIQELTRLFTISQQGKNYLLNKYTGISPNHIKVSRLGIDGDDYRNDAPKGKELVIVSCSYLVPVKRVEIIVKALKELDIPVVWHHIGSGPEENKIQELIKALPPNINARLEGNLTNLEVLQFYKKHPVDLFVNVSSSEGIPVTIMEAFRYGIPAYATEVGGVPEIVSDSSGKLLPVDISPGQLSSYFGEFYRLSIEEKEALRTNARETWEKSYNAAKNYTDFREDLLNSGEQYG